MAREFQKTAVSGENCARDTQVVYDRAMTWVDYTDGALRMRATATIPAPLAEALGAVLAGPPDGRTGEGRGAVRFVPLAEGEAVIRRCLRGGVIRHVVRDRYLFVNRPLAEFELHARLYAEGLPVPEPLAVAWLRRGPWYHGALATRRIDGVSLAARFDQGSPPSAEELARVGRAIARLHDAGVEHGDLNAMNILLSARAAYIIDLDKSRRYTILPTARRRANLARLRRSFQKRGLPMDAFEAIARAYSS